MKRFLPDVIGGSGAVGLLFLRVAAGIAMAMHGWPKIQHPFSWMGADSHIPAFLQALAALSEFGGGLALVVGLLTPIACLGIMSTMFVATWTTLKGGKPLVAMSGGPSAELSFLYFFVALLLLLAGPGKIALDSLLFHKNKGRFGRR